MLPNVSPLKAVQCWGYYILVLGWTIISMSGIERGQRRKSLVKYQIGVSGVTAVNYSVSQLT
jgi:hypothetical protein